LFSYLVLFALDRCKNVHESSREEAQHGLQI
jgi:hypothetical protein